MRKFNDYVFFLPGEKEYLLLQIFIPKHSIIEINGYIITGIFYKNGMLFVKRNDFEKIRSIDYYKQLEKSYNEGYKHYRKTYD